MLLQALSEDKHLVFHATFESYDLLLTSLSVLFLTSLSPTFHLGLLVLLSFDLLTYFINILQCAMTF